MKKVSTIPVILLLLIIIEINTQNLKEKNKKLNNGRVNIPGYPSNPGNNDDPGESGQVTTSPTSSPTTNPNPGSSRARGTNFFEVSRKYYGNTDENSTNVYLQYPEPYTGWENDQCQNSAEQSPINIPYEADFSILKDYGYVEITSVNYNYLESGLIQYQQNHMWGLGILDGGNIKVKISKTEYTFYLSEVYFHLYSEHKLQNRQYPVEMQLVHYSSNYQTDHEKLIISVLFDYSNNKENVLLNELKVGKLQEIDTADFSEIVKRSKPFYYYKGGLTIPPCSNNVHWIIFRDIHDMSYSQFENIKSWIEGSNKYYYNTGYGNSRGLKPLNGRKIYYESKLSVTTKTLSNGTVVEFDSRNSGEIINFMKNSCLLMTLCLLISLF